MLLFPCDCYNDGNGTINNMITIIIIVINGSVVFVTTVYTRACNDSNGNATISNVIMIIVIVINNSVVFDATCVCLILK